MARRDLGLEAAINKLDRFNLLINQFFGEWNKVSTMTLAAVDRLVHHATIFEMNVESYRRVSHWSANAVQDDRRHADN